MNTELQTSPPVQSPEFWMEQLQEGREEALAHLMTRFERPIFSFLHRRLRGTLAMPHSQQGENGVTQELTQEVFLRCLQNSHRFEKGRPVAAWLFTLAANIATDHLRKGGRELPAPENFDAPDPHHESPWEQVDINRKLGALKGAMGRLTPRQRSMVMAYYIKESPIRNIAESFACAEGTVKATLFQSLVKLRKAMGQQP